jgi:hydroxylamine reductase
MFCFQCEQTFKGKGCHKIGVCGKTPRVAALQDLTVEGLKTLSFYAHELRLMGVVDDHVNRFTLFGLFATLTNVNFDETRFVSILAELKTLTTATKAKYLDTCSSTGVKAKRPQKAKELPAVLPGANAVSELEDLGREVSVLTRFTDPSTQSAAGVTEMLVYGIKGIAAYADHSLMNGRENPEIYAFIHKALAFLTTPEQYDLGKGLELLLEAGKVNVATMSLLYDSNTSLGVPEISTVPVKPTPGKAILISGHDLIILKGLLEKTEPLGINVYTHGEMLPAHSYPLLKQHKNLVGHFGGAWMRQAVEFPHFPGPVLMTTNCLTEPHESYAARIFTAGAVGWKGIPHVGDNMSNINFTELIKAAQAAPGFGSEGEFKYADQVNAKRPASYTIGFGHATILSVAPTIVEEIKKGNITRFFLVGGCDGYEGERSYFSDLVARLPKTAVVLTVGCGKFRFNHMNLGTIGETGIPRILDMGQCNDSFSAVQVALALAKVLDCKVSDLPLSIVLSWFEQKAIAVLLSCLALELKPIHVGPALPAFITPDVLSVLVSSFGIRALGDVDEDLRAMVAAPGAS